MPCLKSATCPWPSATVSLRASYALTGVHTYRSACEWRCVLHEGIAHIAYEAHPKSDKAFVTQKVKLAVVGTESGTAHGGWACLEFMSAEAAKKALPMCA